MKEAVITSGVRTAMAKGKKGTLRTDAPKYVTKTPDVDNCIKFVLDALQPKVVADDKSVTKVVAEKKWCDDATAECTTIELLVRV